MDSPCSHSSCDRCCVAPSPDLWADIVDQLSSLGDLASQSVDTIAQALASFGVPMPSVTADLNSVAFYAPSDGTTPTNNDGTAIATTDGTSGGPVATSIDPSVTPVPTPAATSRPPVTGSRKAIVICVDFDETPHTKDISFFQDLLFGGIFPANPIVGMPTTMRDYYIFASGNQLTVDGQVFGWYRMPHPESYYANGQSGMGGTSPNAKTLATDAINAAIAAGVDFSQFDIDNDGYIDGLIIVKAGTGAETLRNAASRQATIWSHKWSLPASRQINGKTVFTYTMQPEDGKLGVFCHEFGHFLGLPDLYDTTYRSRGVGMWCIMGAGSWGNGGDNPVNMSAWCRAQLGWITPSPYTAVTRTGVRFQPAHAGTDIIRVNLAAPARPAEYFLLEYRQQAEIDVSLPSEGLVIWRIDDDAPNNDSPTHYKVVPVQADNNQDLENNRNGGDAGDVFPGSAANTAFTDTSSPAATSWENTPSGVSVTNIVLNPNPGGPYPNITCDITGP